MSYCAFIPGHWPRQLFQPEAVALPRKATAGIVPGAQHDTPRRHPIELELVYRRPMRVAMDQQLHAAGTHGRIHRVGLDVHDLARRALGMAPAAVAGLLRKVCLLYTSPSPRDRQ